MTENIHTTQTDPTVRKRGDRKVTPDAPEKDVAELDQLLTAEEVLHGPAQNAAPIRFDFQGKAVRTITGNGEVWFVAADVCAVLEHGNPTKAVERLDEDERGLTTIQAPSGTDQMMNVVTESGLFSLVFTSRKPEAKAFRRWVTRVVLPTLRRTGKFDMRGGPDQGTTARKQAEIGNSNGITVTLPGLGRYLVVLFHDGELRIEPLCFADAVSSVAALDCRSMAYSHLTAASLWEKLQHLRSSSVKAGYTQEKLNATMQAGADLARQILYTYDEPDLIPRPAGKAAAE
jgi:prophage antirepressor-like protein